jgi:hypothetical protein
VGGRSVISNDIHRNMKSLNASEYWVGSGGMSCLEEVLRYEKGLSKAHTSCIVTGIENQHKNSSHSGKIYIQMSRHRIRVSNEWFLLRS